MFENTHLTPAMKRNTWFVRLGCFLTGYNCDLLRQCSEASYKQLKRYTSALLIIMPLWGFIGFFISKIYMKTDWITSLIAAVFMMFIVVMIERQIILGVGRNGWLSVFRLLLGAVMAVLGATVIDQIFFQDDIERAKVETVQKDVNRILPQKTKELNRMIQEKDSLLAVKEMKYRKLMTELDKKPFLTLTNVRVKRDSTGKVVERMRVTEKVKNPKFDERDRLHEEIKMLSDEKDKLSRQLLTIRDTIEADLRSRKGFLYELGIMMDVVKKNSTAKVVYILWFAFLLAIELLVVISKLLAKASDYDYLIEAQQESRMRKFMEINQ